MKFRTIGFIIICNFISVFCLKSQTDNDPPLSPVLTFVTVNYLTGDVSLSWTLSPSPDVTGYVVYSYRNNEGYPLDTLYNPAITSYLKTSLGSGYFSESYVVAALDSTGNISPLSNPLNTIFAASSIDTCNRKIELKWNKYLSSPTRVAGYTILESVNGGDYTEAESLTSDKTSYIFNDFIIDASYCFVIRANLEGGPASTSNKTCLSARMQHPPDWINADYATVLPDNGIRLSFSIDPSSGIKKFNLERKIWAAGSWTQIFQFSSASGSVLYNDASADISKINYYRLSAVNNCNIPITYSNLSSNMVLSLDRKDDDVKLTWNPYRQWRGAVDSYRIFVKTGNEPEERYIAGPTDSVYHINYSNMMYEISSNDLCFMIVAVETANPFNINGESRSQVICTEITEVITVPNLFTPDNNGINDYFSPVLSFTPYDYRLIITDSNRKTVFETRDHNEKWDGTSNGDHQPEGLYLWFLKLRTPSGKNIERSGTVTIKLTR